MEERKVYNEVPCTCGQADRSCKRHGLGKGGVDVSKVTTTRQARAHRSRALLGNKRRLVTGKFAEVVPSLLCDTCYAGDRCRLYEKGAVCKCASELASLCDQLETQDFGVIIEILWAKLRQDFRRFGRGIWFELIDGGVLDDSLTRLSGSLDKQIETLHKLLRLLGPEGKKDRKRLIQAQVDRLSEKEFAELLKAAAERDLLNSPQWSSEDEEGFT